jgi:hypothetical protein
MTRRVILLSSLLALASAGSCSDEDPYAEYRQQCVDRINEYRATEGLPPYERWKSGERCADSEARSDSQTGEPHGAFGRCDESAQNECPGWPSVESTLTSCLQMMWDEGPGEPWIDHGHYYNMSSTDFNEVACGWHEGSDGVWAVQNFRTRR